MTQILSPQQERPKAELTLIARVALQKNKITSGIRPRTHTLVAGPSGMGKSYIAEELGRGLGVPTLKINASSWQPMGSRAEKHYTAQKIQSWLCSLDPEAGGILILDEIDKIHSKTSWDGYIQLEIHDILDGKMPNNMGIEKDPEESVESYRRRKAKMDTHLENLFSSVFVISCGTWQDAWEQDHNACGFLPNPDNAVTTLQRKQLLKKIQPELLQRHQEKILYLPPMEREDYDQVSANIEKGLSAGLKSVWKISYLERIENKESLLLGMRLFEGVMLTAMIKMGEGKPQSPRKIPKTTPRDREKPLIPEPNQGVGSPVIYLNPSKLETQALLVNTLRNAAKPQAPEPVTEIPKVETNTMSTEDTRFAEFERIAQGSKLDTFNPCFDQILRAQQKAKLFWQSRVLIPGWEPLPPEWNANGYEKRMSMLYNQEAQTTWLPSFAIDGEIIQQFPNKEDAIEFDTYDQTFKSALNHQDRTLAFLLENTTLFTPSTPGSTPNPWQGRIQPVLIHARSTESARVAGKLDRYLDYGTLESPRHMPPTQTEIDTCLTESSNLW